MKSTDPNHHRVSASKQRERNLKAYREGVRDGERGVYENNYDIVSQEWTWYDAGHADARGGQLTIEDTDNG